MEPQDIFWSTHYTRHNQRRQEHLASLGLPLANQTVLEVGAAIGDHTSFFLDRGCTVISTEPRDENLQMLRGRYPDIEVRQLDLDQPPGDPIEADIVYCYGTLYHLQYPATAIKWMARCARSLLLLETCVAAGEDDTVHPFRERAENPDNAVHGHGCRPTRPWLMRELAISFPHVYVPMTQPWHEEFPIDWTRPELTERTLIRGVFVASRLPIENRLLSTKLPLRQTRA